MTLDGGRTWQRAQLQEPRLPIALTRFRLPWRFDGREAVIASRAVDETGYVQPTRDALIAVRGTNSIYHYNGIKFWRVRGRRDRDECGGVAFASARLLLSSATAPPGSAQSPRFGVGRHADARGDSAISGRRSRPTVRVCRRALAASLKDARYSRRSARGVMGPTGEGDVAPRLVGGQGTLARRVR